jgi:D-alanyl-D-alanine carboxypeptidase (penicillin-binding protein 5/6)
MIRRLKSLQRAAVFMLALAAASATSVRSFAQGIQTSARWALLMDADTGSVIFQKDADAPMSPASMVKVLTAEIVFKEIKDGRITLDTEFPVSENAWRTGGAMSRGSAMFARLGDQIKVSDLLRGLIIQSGNDAGIVLAEGLAGSEEAFAGVMNKRARELGMRDSNFTNSWGKSDPRQKTTARDLAKLTVHVIKTYPDFYKIYAETDFTWNKIKQANRNPLLSMNLGADGLKTGNIDDSGFGLIGSAVQGEQRLILVINGTKTAKERADESRKLLTWGFRSFDVRDVFKPGEVVGTASVYGGTSGRVPLVSKVPVRLMIPRGSTERLSARIEYVGPLVAPVEAGIKVANLRVYRGKELTLDTPLYTEVEVLPGPLYSRAFDAVYELATGYIRKFTAKEK